MYSILILNLFFHRYITIAKLSTAKFRFPKENSDVSLLSKDSYLRAKSVKLFKIYTVGI